MNPGRDNNLPSLPGRRIGQRLKAAVSVVIRGEPGGELLVRREMRRDDPDVREGYPEEFVHAAEVQRRLAVHGEAGHWAPIREVGIDAESAWLVRPYFEWSLHDLARVHSFSAAQLWSVVEGLARALEQIASAGLFINGLPFENILFLDRARDHPYLTDPFLTTLSDERACRGTLSDLGAVCYLLLTSKTLQVKERGNVNPGDHDDGRMNRVFQQDQQVISGWTKLCRELLKASEPGSRITLDLVIARLAGLRPAKAREGLRAAGWGREQTSPVFATAREQERWEQGARERESERESVRREREEEREKEARAKEARENEEREKEERAKEEREKEEREKEARAKEERDKEERAKAVHEQEVHEKEERTGAARARNARKGEKGDKQGHAPGQRPAAADPPTQSDAQGSISPREDVEQRDSAPDRGSLHEAPPVSDDRERPFAQPPAPNQREPVPPPPSRSEEASPPSAASLRDPVASSSARPSVPTDARVPADPTGARASSAAESRSDPSPPGSAPAGNPGSKPTDAVDGRGTWRRWGLRWRRRLAAGATVVVGIAVVWWFWPGDRPPKPDPPPGPIPLLLRPPWSVLGILADKERLWTPSRPSQVGPPPPPIPLPPTRPPLSVLGILVYKEREWSSFRPSQVREDEPEYIVQIVRDFWVQTKDWHRDEAITHATLSPIIQDVRLQLAGVNRRQQSVLSELVDLPWRTLAVLRDPRVRRYFEDPGDFRLVHEGAVEIGRIAAMLKTELAKPAPDVVPVVEPSLTLKGEITKVEDRYWLATLEVNDVDLRFRSIGKTKDGKLTFLMTREMPIKAMPLEYITFVKSEYEIKIPDDELRPATRLLRKDLDSLLDPYRLPTEDEMRDVLVSWTGDANLAGEECEPLRKRAGRAGPEPVDRLYAFSGKHAKNWEIVYKPDWKWMERDDKEIGPVVRSQPSDEFLDIKGNVAELVKLNNGSYGIIGGSCYSTSAQGLEQSIEWSDPGNRDDAFSDVGLRLAFDAPMYAPEDPNRENEIGRLWGELESKLASWISLMTHPPRSPLRIPAADAGENPTQ